MKRSLTFTIVFSMLVLGCKINSDPAFNKEANHEMNSNEQRDPFAGVYGIWYSNNETVLSSKYLKGGQIVVQWKDCEPEEGKYDFSKLNDRLKQIAERGLKTAVQINGNSKPDYLFKNVPYLPRQVHVQVLDSLGSLMYWHPYFTQSYLNFISAYAEFIKSSPFKDRIVGIRQNWNAFGTEQLEFAGIRNLKESEWIVPQGVTYVNFDAERMDGYREKILERFLNDFTPEIKVFVRSNVPNNLLLKHEAYFNNGLAGWFHTGAGMEQNQRFNSPYRYSRYLEYCRTGKTVGFSESNSHLYDKNRDNYPYSDVQWVYWRVLSELHNGVSYIAMRPYAFEKAHDGEAEYIKILEMANKYAGYHARPSVSPGAWIAFRGKGDNFDGDYTFHMNIVGNAQLADMKLVGDRNSPYGAWAQKLIEGGKLYLNIDDAFFAKEKASNGISAIIRIVYFDSSTGSWAIKYDSAMEPEKTASLINNQGDNQWKILEIPIIDGRFNNGCTNKADIIIENINADCILHMIEILRR